MSGGDSFVKKENIHAISVSIRAHIGFLLCRGSAARCASVYGLLLLLLALCSGIVRPEQVRETGLFLTGIFPLLFVPAAAGVMELWAELGVMLLPAVIAIVPVTVLVFAAAGRTTQALIHRKEKTQNEISV